MKIPRPNTIASSLLEVGGYGPMSNGDMRDKHKDISHLLAFLYDLASIKDTAHFISEMRWKESIGVLHKRCFPQYKVPVSFIVTRVMAAH